MSPDGAAGAVAPLPPFIPPAWPGATDAVSTSPILQAPLSPPVYLPPGSPMAPDEPAVTREMKGAGHGFVGRPLGASPVAASPSADALPLVPSGREGASAMAMDEALQAIHELVLDLRQHAGVAASGDPSMATWFSVRRPEGSGGHAVPPAPASAVAADAARHLEEVAQRVRAGELPLLEVAGPLREGSALALTLAALHGARSPDSAGGHERRGP